MLTLAVGNLAPAKTGHVTGTQDQALQAGQEERLRLISTPNALGARTSSPSRSSTLPPGQKPDRDPTPEEERKDPAAVALGKQGGAARATKLSDARRKEIAERAAASRWKRD